MQQISRMLQRNSISSATHLITDNRLLMTLALALALSGCMGVYEGGFECPPGKGLGCTSISEVHEMVNRCSVNQYSSIAECKLSEELPIKEKSNKTSSIWFNPQTICNTAIVQNCNATRGADAKSSF